MIEVKDYLSCDCLQIESRKAMLKFLFWDGLDTGYYLFEQEFEYQDGYFELGRMTVIEGVRPDSTNERLEREQIIDTLNVYTFEFEHNLI